MKFFLFCFTIFLFLIIPAEAQKFKVLESNSEFIKIEFEFDNAYKIIDTLIEGKQFQLIKGIDFTTGKVGEPWLPEFGINIGVPHFADPLLIINRIETQTYSNKFIIPVPDDDPDFSGIKVSNINKQIYSQNSFYPRNVAAVSSDYKMRYARIINVSVSPFQFNPVSRELKFNRKIILQVNYNYKQAENVVQRKIGDKFTEDFLKTGVVNYEQAVNWVTKPVTVSKPMNTNDYWYNPNKNYYKIYLKEKGVYRITYEYLESANIPVQNLDITKLQLFNGGEEVPLYVNDINGNNVFEPGEYFEFVGFPPEPSPYSGLNIYNLENVYWFSYEADLSGKRYIPKDGYPNSWINSFDTTPYTIHFEKDSLYERLGHADDDQRDYWFWGKSSGDDGSLTELFSAPFPLLENIPTDASSIKVRVNMHGMTLNDCINPDHKVNVLLTSQLIGEHTWDGSTASTFETEVDLSEIKLFASNNFQVATYGDIPDPCDPTEPGTDEIRVNWFEIEYPRTHRSDANHFVFKSPSNVTELIRFNVFNWQRDNMKIFVPQRGEMLVNSLITNDEFKSVFFVDNLFERTEYFCAAEDYFLSPDSIIHDNSSSDLRNLSNGADYIIITHHNFRSAADRLADFRSSNFPDENIISPRISVVDVQDIYDEFSYGLVDPFAVQSFIKYAFENWQVPSPSYIVLFGDMSYDYRHLFASSRPNFIPSIPYHTATYGQAASDNMFVAVSGSDVVPDLAIGRLSCETLQEANILVDKIINYPGDNSKKWKQNVLLLSSGLSENDEASFGFNDSNLLLDSLYLKPQGISSKKIFRYSNKPAHVPFQGEGPEIRNGFDEGAAIASYYGHGGGYQWDLVFNNDDIYQLNNEGRLPIILSVTCYTAHFDNQDVFGEQFNKIPDKGSVAFWGSSGLTYWGVGKSLNEKVFDEIFKGKNYILGKFTLAAKTQAINPGSPLVASQIALLTLLGDPVLKVAIPDKPDFEITSPGITTDPVTPSVGDTISVKVKIFNYGIIFPADSAVVQLFVSSSDTSYSLNNLKLASFGEVDSAIFTWIPAKGGLYNLTAQINQDGSIPELDNSDNEATAILPVYDFGEPNIINPVNGFVSTSSEIKFLFADNGNILSTDSKYLIEIDSSLEFTNPIIKSPPFQPTGGIASWVSPPLQEGFYFWRARIYNGQDSSSWSATRAITIDAENQNQGYFISDKHLRLLETNNVVYSDSLKNLILNTNLLPPRPSSDKFIEDIPVTLPPDINGLSTFTTDGTYLYFGHIAFYGGPTKIYMLGTGYNGTVKGQLYGEIPNLSIPVWHQIFYYSDGYIYIATGDAFNLLKVNPQTGDTSRVFIPDGLLNSIDAKVRDGAFYIATDGNLVYNVAYINEQGEFKYTIRVLDPHDSWRKVREDIIASGQSYSNFTGFFVADGYFYPHENYWGGYIRRINLEDGIYEEEWLSFEPYQGFYAWAYDWINNVVYASVFKDGYQPKFSKFSGEYLDAFGSITSNEVGPASSWNSLKYDIDAAGSNGSYNTYLEGLNKATRNWDTLFVNSSKELDLTSVNADVYSHLRFRINLVDSSYTLFEPIKVKSLNISYTAPPEIIITKDDISFSPDTVLQGFDTELTVKITNYGMSDAQDLKVDYYYSSIDFPSGDTLYFTRSVSVPKESQVIYKDTLHTSSVLFNNLMKIVVTNPKTEFFTFNNIAGNSFFVARDSTDPLFRITFDGKEITNGDIISAKPEVLISLKDDSPLPIDTSDFSLVYDNFPLSFSDPDLQYTYTPYPNSEALLKWSPQLKDGRHTLEVLAKDASGNFFDTTSYRTIFYVYNDADLREVYNYPNPFKNDTYFTFELRGVKVPDEFLINVYTIAGRLIRKIPVPVSSLQVGFNRIYWDGRDQDGDEIANGLYFYKIIAKNSSVVKTAIQKLAKVK